MHRGPEPKGARLGHSPNAEWTEVPDQPFEAGRRRELPSLGRRKWNEQVVKWWHAVRIMPHCVLWTETDWIFAAETAMMKHEYWTTSPGDRKTTEATEIRRREDTLGVTRESLRKLRIRYTAVDDGVQRSPGGPGVAGVTPIDSRRGRLTA